MYNGPHKHTFMETFLDLKCRTQCVCCVCVCCLLCISACCVLHMSVLGVYICVHMYYVWVCELCLCVCVVYKCVLCVNLSVVHPRCVWLQHQISKDIRWVSQNTTLYYGVRCHRVDDMFRPFIIRPSSGLTWWKLKRKITMLHIAYTHSMLWLRGGC